METVAQILLVRLCLNRTQQLMVNFILRVILQNDPNKRWALYFAILLLIDSTTFQQSNDPVTSLNGLTLTLQPRLPSR